jgi:hypothetical protein
MIDIMAAGAAVRTERTPTWPGTPPLEVASAEPANDGDQVPRLPSDYYLG